MKILAEPDLTESITFMRYARYTKILLPQLNLNKEKSKKRYKKMQLMTTPIDKYITKVFK